MIISVPDIVLKFAKQVELFLYLKASLFDLDNYLPISILCVISKIIERHIYDSLFNILIPHDLILPNQSGFYEKSFVFFWLNCYAKYVA